ncbi:hypothetical protein KEM52_006080 [Ascosphaera acerosa]|nr:hypothetical protein KEM52_006080 [Ascosphaera acerosa]
MRQAAHAAQTPGSCRILYVDAYDSFAYNIVDLIKDATGAEVTCISMDALSQRQRTPDSISRLLRGYAGVVLGPGPGTPLSHEDIGCMEDIIAYGTVPVLGICLGFQVICRHFGAGIKRLREPKHGRVVDVAHSGSSIFSGLPRPLSVTLYHSLRVEVNHPLETAHSPTQIGSELAWESSESCRELVPLAWYHDNDENGAVLMAVRHQLRPIFGMQFHPESCASSTDCREIITRWTAELHVPDTQCHTWGDDSTASEPANGLVAHDQPQSLLAKFAEADDDTTVGYGYRSFRPPSSLTSERVNEALNDPSQHNVVLESDTRWTVVSVTSPGAFAMAYSLATQQLSLQMLHKSDRIETHACVSAGHVWDEIREYLHHRRLERQCSGDQGSLQRSVAQPDIPFWGGFLGFASYEMGLDSINQTAVHLHPASKDLAFLWVDRSVVIDKADGRFFIQSLRANDSDAGGWLDQTAARLMQLRDEDSTRSDTVNGSNLLCSALENARVVLPDEHAYKRQVLACQRHIAAGDSYELCLTAETTVSIPSSTADPAPSSWSLYKALRRHNPGAFSGFANLPGVDIVSSSPECYLQWTRTFDFEMKPMKGTVKKTPAMTLEKAHSLLNSDKEMAENLMIADLIRHDLTRTFGTQSTHVQKLCAVEDHGRVYQMITHVTATPGSASRAAIAQAHGRLSGQASPHDFEALRHTLPPGSMTGAPKVRSCQLLADIEQRQRGVYSGVMGFLDVGGAGSFSVIIRTAFRWQEEQEQCHTWRIGAGGAVTALSTPDGEWDEMITKLDTVLGVLRSPVGP